jgi:hypothetical protein
MLERVPVNWTDLAPQTPFVEVSAGRSYFTIEGLLELHCLMEKIESEKSVK